MHRILSVGLHVSRLLVNASKGRITGFTKVFTLVAKVYWVVGRDLLWLIGCTGWLLGCTKLLGFTEWLLGCS